MHGPDSPRIPTGCVLLYCRKCTRANASHPLKRESIFAEDRSLQVTSCDCGDVLNWNRYVTSQDSKESLTKVLHDRCEHEAVFPTCQLASDDEASDSLLRMYQRRRSLA